VDVDMGDGLASCGVYVDADVKPVWGILLGDMVLCLPQKLHEISHLFLVKIKKVADMAPWDEEEVTRIDRKSI
jgi:hypothetical protein